MYYSGKEDTAKHMQSLGVKLRLERERQKIGIQKIAEDTRIAQRYLEAIEADDLASLPGEFFYRAFVRQYSKYIGWDPDETEKMISLVSSVPSFEAAAPIAASSSTSLSVARDPQISALRESLKDKPMRDAQEPGLSKAWIAFATVIIVACGGYFAWRNFPAATGTATVAASAAPVAEQPAPKTAAPPVVQTAQTEAPKPPEPVPQAPQQPVTAKPAEGQFNLTLRAKETTWIRITSDGAKTFGGTLDAGQERSINARMAEIIIGNAGTLDVIYNGQLLHIGNKGEVKTLLINSEGWKFKPKAPPAEPSSTTGNGSPGASAPGSF